MPSAEYMREYRERRKAEYVIKLGGVCSIPNCGISESLEFDHIDPATKLFNISGFSRSKKEIEAELVKCQLLCPDHHREKTRRDLLARIPFEHGGMKGYWRGCKCPTCMLANRAYHKAYSTTRVRVVTGDTKRL